MANITDKRLSSLVVSVYDAAMDPALWPAFYRQYAEIVPSAFVGIQVHDFGRKRSMFVSTSGETRGFKESYHEYYSKRNIWRERGKRLFAAGCVVLSQEHTPVDLLRSSEFYNDFLKPECIEHSLAAVIHRDSERAINFSANRGDDYGAFDEDERRLTEVLLPHINRAYRVHQRLELLAASEDILVEVPVGILFLASGGRVVFANNAAEAILNRRDGLFVRDKLIRCVVPAADRDLANAVRLSEFPGNSFECPKVLLVARRDAEQPYHVMVAPVRRNLQPFAGCEAPCVVLFIKDPNVTRTGSAAVLKQLYGLTGRESAVVQELVKGVALRRVAEELGMSYETARCHLRRIFDKTCTTRQSQLVRLAGSIFAVE